jgi:predicted GIY-YIG superfamily endonuclease
VGVRRFDRKFGADLLSELPDTPGVYLFRDAGGDVLYAGKAKNVRRRLASYRSATRRKAHRKMRTLVREAASLEVRLQPSERAALLAENELIRTLRPRYNVEGTYSFLYPAIGIGSSGAQTLVAFTTQPEAWEALGLAWHGVFRSRLRAREAYDALTELLGRIGHLEPGRHLPPHRRLRGSRLLALRRLDADLLHDLMRFLRGDGPEILEELAVRLVERRAARRQAARVEEALRQLEAFYRSDLLPLRDAMRAAGRSGSFVRREERDALFISTRHG